MNIFKKSIYLILLCALALCPIHASVKEAVTTEFKTLDECCQRINFLTDSPYNNVLFEPENILIIFGVEEIITTYNLSKEQAWWHLEAKKNAKEILTKLKADGHHLVFSSPKHPFTAALTDLFVTGLHDIAELTRKNYPFSLKGNIKDGELKAENHFWRDQISGIEKPIVHATHGLLSSVRLSGEDNTLFQHKAFAMFAVYQELLHKESELSQEIKHVILVDNDEAVLKIFQEDMKKIQGAGYLPNLFMVHIFKIIP